MIIMDINSNNLIIGGKIDRDSVTGPYADQLYNLRVAIATYNSAIQSISNRESIAAVLNAKCQRQKINSALEAFNEAKRNNNDLILTVEEQTMIGLINGLDQTFEYKTKEDILNEEIDYEINEHCVCCGGTSEIHKVEKHT